MIYLCVAIAFPFLWFFPWWSLILLAAFAGWFGRSGILRALYLGVGCGLAWAGLAFIKDHAHDGIVSRRMAGMFNLPHPMLIFAVLFAIGFISVFLTFMAAASWRRTKDF